METVKHPMKLYIFGSEHIVCSYPWKLKGPDGIRTRRTISVIFPLTVHAHHLRSVLLHPPYPLLFYVLLWCWAHASICRYLHILLADFASSLLPSPMNMFKCSYWQFFCFVLFFKICLFSSAAHLLIGGFCLFSISCLQFFVNSGYSPLFWSEAGENFSLFSGLAFPFLNRNCYFRVFPSVDARV